MTIAEKLAVQEVESAANVIVLGITMGEYRPPKCFDDARRLVSAVIGEPFDVGLAWHSAVAAAIMRRIS